MNCDSDDNPDFKQVSNIIDEKEIIIKNYDDIKNKTSYVKKITVDKKMYSNNNIYIEKKLKIEDFQTKKLLKYNTLNEHNYSNNINQSNSNFIYTEKINEINKISSKIDNLIYSKVNKLDFNKFNSNYYSSNIYNLLSYNKIKKFKNYSFKKILKFIYYEYNKKNNPINFYSNFELGNLSMVYKNWESYNEYDLILSSDKNIDLSTGWFYFKFIGGKKGDIFKFNIINLIRNKSLYKNKKIAIKSTKYDNNKIEKNLDNWKYQGENIIFKKDNQSDFFVLSFEYTIKYENEIVYIAENIPYDIERNNKFIYSLNDKKKKEIKVSRNTFNFTNTGFPNYYIKITMDDNIKNKPSVIFISRIQPSHNCSSYVLEGMIKYLLKNENLCIDFFLNNFQIIIIPFLSFEMVLFGNTRHTLDGINLTKWNNDKIYKSTEIQGLKKLLLEIKKNSEIMMIFELHDNQFKYDYYLHYFSDLENIEELNNINDFLNILNYNMNFFRKDKTVMIQNNKKIKMLRKDFKIKYFFNFYISTYGNEQNQIEFFNSDYKNIGKSLLYCISLFFGKIDNKLKGYDNIKSINKEIDEYYSKINTEEYKLFFKRKDSNGSNDYFFINNEEMKSNPLMNKINEENCNLLDEEIKKEDFFQKKLVAKYKIKHIRNHKTKYYDYIIKRDKQMNFKINKIKENKKIFHKQNTVNIRKNYNILKNTNLINNISYNNTNNNNPIIINQLCITNIKNNNYFNKNKTINKIIKIYKKNNTINNFNTKKIKINKNIKGLKLSERKKSIVKNKKSNYNKKLFGKILK